LKRRGIARRKRSKESGDGNHYRRDIV
jgi:hypothetical protein